MSKGFYLIPRSGGIAYLNMPKAGCSSILRALAQLRSSEAFPVPEGMAPDGSDPIHGFWPPTAHLEWFYRRWPLDFPRLPAGMLTFTFVRNPYARLLSFYKSKVIAGQSPIDYYERRLGIKRGASLEDVVIRITSADPQELEHHASPQSSILFGEAGPRAAYVGKIEHAEQDWNVIRGLTGIQTNLGRANAIPSRSDSAFTPALRDRVYDYFKDDFELFGYSRDSMAEVDVGGRPIDAAVYDLHHKPSDVIADWRARLASGRADAEARAAAFTREPRLRAKYFRRQEEQFRELAAKQQFHIEQEVMRLKERLGELWSVPRNLAKLDERQRSDTERLSAIIESDRTLRGLLESRLIGPGREHMALGLLANRVQALEIHWKAENTQHQTDLASLRSSLATVTRERDQLAAQMRRAHHSIDTLTSGVKRLLLIQFARASEKRKGRLLTKVLRNSAAELRELASSGAVDAVFYLAEYPEARQCGLSPAEHYFHVGAREGKNPSPSFDTLDYLVNHQELAESGENPLLHWLRNQEQ